MSDQLHPLEKSLRKDLETAVKKARDVAESAAEAALDQLEVGAAKTESLEKESDKELRRRLRIHGRQLGDKRDKKSEKQELDRLREEIAYQHWHRMLFARFLAENRLLMYPDPDDPVAVTLGDCEDLVDEVNGLMPELFPERPRNGWEVAAKFAARMLPQIFRVDSPVFEVTLPTEKQQQLEKLLSGLPGEVFTASDSLGWVYQFWQAKRNEEVNASEEKIGARELPAATQFFTEPYMVSFLLDNSLGAWWAARRLTAEDLQTASSEQELREKAALPGVPLEYLRFVRTPSGDQPQGVSTGSQPTLPLAAGEGSDVSGKALAAGSSTPESTADTPAASAVGSQEENIGPWTPAAGTFDAWPESLSELKTLDPCCGSGHFLVAALLILTPMRMELEGLSASEAVDRVLSENLHGLEIDQRCVELAAFALALAAWRYPDLPAPEPTVRAAGTGGAVSTGNSPEASACGSHSAQPIGYRVLPDLNVACCGLSVSVAKEEWKELARGDTQLKIALDWMYDEFKDAPVLGSLLNPEKSMASKVVPWDELVVSVEEALSEQNTDQEQESGVVAKGLAKAAVLLSSNYTLVMTNVPYLGRGKQNDTLANCCQEIAEDAKADLSTVFCSRSLDWVGDNGAVVLVAPQNWLFLKSYKAMRKRLLEAYKWNFVVQLGKNAFNEMNWWAATTSLVCLAGEEPAPNSHFVGFDVGGATDPAEKSDVLAKRRLTNNDDQQKRKAFEGSSIVGPLRLRQSQQIDNPDHRIIISDDWASAGKLLEEFADSLVGIQTGDDRRYVANFWEHARPVQDVWEFLQATPQILCRFSGCENVVRWEKGIGELHNSPGAYLKGLKAVGKPGLCMHRMGGIHAYHFSKSYFHQNVAVLSPKVPERLSSIVAFCESPEYLNAIRKVDQKLNVTNATLAKVPFDLTHWQRVASEKYPHGLPEPYSDDPTQWIFHGHPASSTDALQVAVARLLGYRWPAELDAEMELATDARAWVERSSQLYDSSQNDLADTDGIVCIPAVGTEQPAEDRLLNLLHRAYEQGRAQEQVFRDKLDAADEKDPVTVDLWRRGWQPALPETFNGWQQQLLSDVGYQGKGLDAWLREKFFTQHCKLFQHRPFIWHIWDGEKDGFAALVNYHKLDNKLLGKLIHTHLNKWIRKQEKSSEDGHEQRLAAAKSLQLKLERILEGESPHDIFVRWKSLAEQPIGWNPDLNDGVRLNIRPWMTVGDVGKKDAGVLRDKPNCKWGKDRGKDVESAPWYHLGPEYGGKEGDRINDHHLTLAEKQAAQDDQ